MDASRPECFSRITPLDWARFQFQNAIFLIIYHHCLCIFVSTKQEAVNHTHQNLYQRKRPTIYTASLVVVLSGKSWPCRPSFIGSIRVGKLTEIRFLSWVNRFVEYGTSSSLQLPLLNISQTISSLLFGLRKHSASVGERQGKFNDVLENAAWGNSMTHICFHDRCHFPISSNIISISSLIIVPNYLPLTL